MALSISKIIVAATIVLFIGIHVSAQSTAHAIASANVTEIVGVRTSPDINSKTFFIGSKGGVIEFSAEGIAVEAASGNSVRSFRLSEAPLINVIGDNFTYTVTIPPSAVLKKTGGKEIIETDHLVISPSLNGNREILYLGGTFKISAFQASGEYTSITPIAVTVHYD